MGAGQVMALGIGAIFPAGNGLLTMMRRGHVDIIGAIVLVGILGSTIATMIGGDAKLLLIRESFVTLGAFCLLSLFWTPADVLRGATVLARQRSSPHRDRNGLWQRPRARRTFA